MKKYKIRPMDEKLSNEILLDIYFNYNCNYKCSYCYSEKNNKVMSFENLNKFINIVKNIKNISLKVLGGEPLLYKHLKYFIEKIIYEKNVSNIEITTNGFYLSNFINFFNKYSKHYENSSNPNNSNTKLNLEVSIHPEYINENYLNNLLNNLKLININILLVINFTNYIYDKLFLNFLEKLKKYKNFTVEINPIITEKIKYNIFQNEELIDFLNQNKLISYHQNISFKINNTEIQYEKLYKFLEFKKFNFKNSLCYLNYFKVTPDLVFSELCTGKIIDPTDIKIHKIICPNTYCDPSCFFNIKKDLIFK